MVILHVFFIIFFSFWLLLFIFLVMIFSLEKCSLGIHFTWSLRFHVDFYFKSYTPRLKKTYNKEFT